MVTHLNLSGSLPGAFEALAKEEVLEVTYVTPNYCVNHIMLIIFNEKPKNGKVTQI